MRQAEHSSVFSAEPHGARSANLFDLPLIGRDLRRAFTKTLAEPVPEHWQSLLRRLDEPAGFREIADYEGA